MAAYMKDICAIQILLHDIHIYHLRRKRQCGRLCYSDKGHPHGRFKKDPVMLYMHAREKGVIGRWDNIRTEGSQLIADAVFDEITRSEKRLKSV